MIKQILNISDLRCGYDGKTILKGISFDVKAGEFIGIVGPNGSGKTTLLRAISRLIQIESGEILIAGKKFAALDRKEFAKEVALVPQLIEPIAGFSVFDMVLLGRTPYIDRFKFASEEDYQVVDWAIKEVEIESLKNKEVTELSGGEFQRVVIARALAQEPKLMLLDEPISHLDLRYQVKTLKLLKKIKQQRTVISTFHDLNMAMRFCKRIILFRNGEILADGEPQDVITPENVWKAYRVKVQIKNNPRTKNSSLMFLP